MRYLSVCSGIEAATVAWHPFGWEPVAFAEIDKAASAVLGHHYPDVPNIGDFTKIKGDEYGAVDLLVGGTPCQDFSVAGLRAGMDGERGQLTVEFAHFAGRIRPRWLVWENVPGVLSIDEGRAFGTFIGLLGKLGYGIAYRILDAQYIGVPQRRRRVFVVGYLGDWRRAAAVLFERHSLSGHPPPSRKARQDVASPTDGSIVGSLCARDSKTVGNQFVNEGKVFPVNIPSETVCMATGQGSAEIGIGIGTTLNCNHEAPIVAFSCKDHGADAGEISPTLRGIGHDKSHANAGGQIAVAIQNATRGQDQNGLGISTDDTMYTLDQGSQHGVAFVQNSRDEVRLMGGDGQVVGALSADIGAKQQCYISGGMAVRRLTPRECERLQGFPDDYTLVQNRGKPMADGPRYKMLGNSMAVPCMVWIGKRIMEVEEING